MVYLISYDLHQEGQDYKSLFDTIKSCSTGTWWHYLESTWIIKSNSTVNQISEKIKNVSDDNDNFLVIEVINNKQGWLPQEAWGHLNNSVF